MGVSGRHSAKPVEAYERIERLFGNVSRVELFARCNRQGWSAFGNQVETSIRLPTNPPSALGSYKHAKGVLVGMPDQFEESAGG